MKEMKEMFRSSAMKDLDCLVRDAMTLYILTDEEKKAYYGDLLAKALEYKLGAYNANNRMALGETDIAVLSLLGKYIKENIRK